MTGSPCDSASPPDNPPHHPQDRPYHSKRPHKKSRTGCKSCKTRKVKCDETRPACRSCRLRKTECVYPSPQPSRGPSSSAGGRSVRDHESPKPDLSGSSDASPPAPFSSAALVSGRKHHAVRHPSDPDDVSIITEPLFLPETTRDDFDMRLLWFYTIATSGSFSLEPEQSPVRNLMRTGVVQLAFRTPFLMQSIFALAALHIQALGQEIDPNRALAYRAASFEGYRKAVEEADPETFPALLVNSLLLTALSSQTFRDPSSKDLYIIDWMAVWRGIGLMIDLMGPRKIAEAGLSILFYRPPINLETPTYTIPDQLFFMVSSIEPDDVDYPDTHTYYATLRCMGALYYSLKQGLDPTMCLRIVTWLTFIPYPFIELSRQKRPRALVILAYYGVFLKIADSLWWYKDIGQRIVCDICRYLGPDWVDLLKVPRLAMQNNDPFDLARIILEDPDWTSPPWTGIYFR